MKRFLICAAICVVAFAFIGDGFCADQSSQFNALSIKRAKNDDYKGADSFSIEQQSGTTKVWRIDKTGNMSILDVSGVTDTYIPRDRVVIINKATQLSTWQTLASATGGQSYFQCEPGTTYLVDIYAIATSGVTAGNGVSAFTTVSFTGVSAILPNADKYSGPAYDVTVGLAVSGATGYYPALAGATPVQVWSYPGTVSGLTAYGKPSQAYAVAYRSGNTPQSMAGPVVSTSGSFVSGGSRWEINKLGDFSVFGLQSSSVSSYVKQYKP